MEIQTLREHTASLKQTERQKERERQAENVVREKRRADDSSGRNSMLSEGQLVSVKVKKVAVASVMQGMYVSRLRDFCTAKSISFTGAAFTRVLAILTSTPPQSLVSYV